MDSLLGRARPRPRRIEPVLRLHEFTGHTNEEPMALCKFVIKLMLVTIFAVSSSTWAAGNLPERPTPKPSICNRLLSGIESGSLHIHNLSVETGAKAAEMFARVMDRLPNSTAQKIYRYLADRSENRSTINLGNYVMNFPALLGHLASKVQFNFSEIGFSLGFGARVQANLNSRILLVSSQDIDALADLIRAKIPDWDNDQNLWAFEAPRDMSLFTAASKLPYTYEKGTLVVMRDMFPERAFPVIEITP